MNLKKTMLAVVATVLAFPAMAQVSNLEAVYEDAAVSKQYIRGLQEELANRGIDNQAEDYGAYKVTFYSEMAAAAQDAVKKASSEENNLRAFGLMSQKFEQEMGVNPAKASMEQYKAFYRKYSNNPIVLVTIAMWQNRGFEGIAPYRHQGHPFWDEPEQAGGMYETMAQIDPEKTLGSMIFYIIDDFAKAYPQFPEMDDTDQTQEEYAHEYFTRFAAMGDYAAKDASKLEGLVVELLKHPADEQ